MESSELLGILEQLERDKGIQKEILIEAVEAAVASAAKKLWTVGKDDEVRVVLNTKTGKLTAYAGEQEIRSSEFGRIAAQTAKQVVIQKIREAEKDVVFNEYHSRIGEIISGGVYRFEKGNIIIDLGKTEACIPKKEQSGKEEFRQGDRIRAYLLDVSRESRGPQIILSRAHPNFVKRLFEMEVPEIYEGIVEIKSISRDVGERTKVAVYSKDEKVDCVGACVGMRGSRVKNIVSELQGEKIDIVRYSSDIKEYIQAALSPAEISQIQLNFDDQKANIIVADDQLSLAIGKHGQNVRLASKLVAWELNLFSLEQWQKYQQELEAQEEVEEKKISGKKDRHADLSDLAGVGDKLIAHLKELGLDTLEKISKANIEDLTQIKGLGKIKAQKIIDEAKSLQG
ncbi:MAG TPA: transcription termination/antitermination protein NusA [Candidatus Omnitrophica bacterium]|nr:MAG: transcription termination factor NusA [Omnitrophica WOR_2 bacterium GWA2_45_18]HBR15200.1 transcription termination/antitermination protein NusA [Candidatus Omnitrophota bacterium]